MAVENSVIVYTRIWTWMNCSISVTFLRMDSRAILVVAAAKRGSSISLAADQRDAAMACC